MLELEVVPEHGLQTDQWEIILGMHFSQTIAIVQSQVRLIKAAHVIYNNQSPLTHDLILDLPKDGFRMLYDSKSQRLRLIEIYNLKLLQLNYCGVTFNGSDVVPTVEQIDRCFGATRPGSYDKENKVFVLSFRGLCFFFPVDMQYQSHYNHGLGSLRFPGDASPILSKILIYFGNNISEAPVPPLPTSCFKGQIYCDECVVLRNITGTKTLGIKLKLFGQNGNGVEFTRENFEREIRFGEHAESIIAKLGTPNRVFYKSEDKMKIHSKEAHKRVSNPKSDYFFNYFTIGLDILFDLKSHRAVKFILHTNFPGHYDFNSYHRCPFALKLKKAKKSQSSVLINSAVSNMSSMDLNPLPSSDNSVCGAGVGNREKGGGSNKHPKSPKSKKNKQSANATNNENNVGMNKDISSLLQMPSVMDRDDSINMKTDTKYITVTYDSLWESVSGFVCDPSAEPQRPVVLTRSSSNNPFGPSLCYGYQDIIFEVMSNDHIASLTLYQFEPYCAQYTCPSSYSA